jgi:hypothetical protein
MVAWDHAFASDVPSAAPAPADDAYLVAIRYNQGMSDYDDDDNSESDCKAVYLVKEHYYCYGRKALVFAASEDEAIKIFQAEHDGDFRMDVEILRLPHEGDPIVDI